MTALKLARNLAAWLAVLSLAGPVLAQQAELARIEVFPPAISLAGANDRQSLVVQATFADGITRDVTREATLTPANPALVRLDGSTLATSSAAAWTQPFCSSLRLFHTLSLTQMTLLFASCWVSDMTGATS